MLVLIAPAKLVKNLLGQMFQTRSTGNRRLRFWEDFVCSPNLHFGRRISRRTTGGIRMIQIRFHEIHCFFQAVGDAVGRHRQFFIGRR